MPEKDRRKHRSGIYLNEEDIALALKMASKIEDSLELLLYLMRRNNHSSLVLMLLSAESRGMYDALVTQKRDTDLVVEIDSEKNVYAVFCQDTKVDEGYHFAQRLQRHFGESGIEGVHIVEVEMNSSNYNTKEITFKLIELYFKSKQQENEGQIGYYTFG